MDKPSVLVVDDNEATCTLITAVLKNDFSVEIAGDGQEAIAKLEGRRYAAILLDLLMPRADGYVFLDHLTGAQPGLLRSVIVITAAIGERQMERLRQYDVRLVLPKPFEVEELLATVRRCAGEGFHVNTPPPIVSGGMLLLLADLLRRMP